MKTVAATLAASALVNFAVGNVIIGSALLSSTSVVLFLSFVLAGEDAADAAEEDAAE